VKPKDQLVATWGNLGQRPRGLGFILSFTYKRFDGQVPGPGELDDEDQALLEKVEAGFETVGELYAACKFRAALGEAMALAREAKGNVRAFDASPRCRSCEATAQLTLRVSPGSQIKEDRQAAATTVYVILRVVDNLKNILAPLLPHTPVPTHRTQKLHEYLGYEGQPFGSAQGKLFGTQKVVEYEEETRSHAALTYDHSGACQPSPVMGPSVFGQGGPLPEMTIGKLLTKNGQTMVARQGHGVDSMDTSFPGPFVPWLLKLAPVMTIIWARGIKRSRPAEANGGLPKRSGHSSGARLLVSMMLPRSYRSLMTS
jgi:hypothetical protein